jgi:hypothetical protein
MCWRSQLQWKIQSITTDVTTGIDLNRTRFIGNKATSGAAIHYPCATLKCPNLDLQSDLAFSQNTAVGGDGHILWAVQVREPCIPRPSEMIRSKETINALFPALG